MGDVPSKEKAAPWHTVIALSQDDCMLPGCFEMLSRNYYFPSYSLVGIGSLSPGNISSGSCTKVGSGLFFWPTASSFASVIDPCGKCSAGLRPFSNSLEPSIMLLRPLPNTSLPNTLHLDEYDVKHDYVLY